MNADEPATNLAPLERFVAACAAALRDACFERLLLSGYRGPLPDLKRVTAFAFQVGEPIPRERWEALGLPAVH